MAQIYGIQNHQRTNYQHTSTNENKFVTHGGIEFMLHELEPPEPDSSATPSYMASAKKRGRPRKDAVSYSSFEGSPPSHQKKEKMDKREKKLLRLERKEKIKEISRRIDFDEYSPENDDNGGQKKRGRPRKTDTDDTETENDPNQFQLSSFNCVSNSDTLTPPYSELSETGSVAGGREFSMMEILNLNQVEETAATTATDNQLRPEEVEVEFFDFDTKWTPIQRLTQFNQALAFTTMYKDAIFWDRIVAEFASTAIKFRLEIGTEKSFDIPFLVLSKFYWICAQLGLHRIQFLFTGLSEKLRNEDVQPDGVLLNSSDAFIYSHMYNDRLLITHRTRQFIEFDSSAKISNWTININKHDEFFKKTTTTTSSDQEMDELIWGYPKKAIEFLDVALVMNTVLPDSVSWLTWFYTYTQQNGLKSFSIVELSRPPSPFQFPTHQNDINQQRQQDDMDFFEKGRDFIFNVLNTASMELTNNTDFDGQNQNPIAPSEFSTFEDFMQELQGSAPQEENEYIPNVEEPPVPLLPLKAFSPTDEDELAAEVVLEHEPETFVFGIPTLFDESVLFDTPVRLEEVVLVDEHEPKMFDLPQTEVHYQVVADSPASTLTPEDMSKKNVPFSPVAIEDDEYDDCNVEIVIEDDSEEEEDLSSSLSSLEGEEEDFFDSYN